MSASSSSRVVKLGAVVVVLVALACAHRAGWLARFAQPSLLAQTVLATGVWGYVAFVVAYTALQPFGVPGTIFIVAAPLIWPWPIAFALSMAGTMGASVVGFSFARFVAKDWVTPRVPARLRKYDDALATRGLLTVVALRLVLWMPQPLHFAFGVSKVGFWTHFWGSLIGYTPPLLAVSYLGGEMFDPTSGTMKRDAWPIMAAFAAASLAIALAFRAYERRRAARARGAG